MDPRDQEENKAPPYSIRKAMRSSSKPTIGLYSLSGGGKTYSSLILARGCVGPEGRIVMIETEEGRGEAYADPQEHPEIGGYEVIPMSGNFSPRAYGMAIDVANKARPDALIIDSGSHEWAGIGGVLDMAYKNEEAGKKGLQVWQKPKIDHQMYFLNRILQTPIPLVILNLRAKYPMVEEKNDRGRTVPVRSKILEPIQSEDILYELFVHGWIDREHKFHVGNSPSKSLREIFPDGEPITLETGRKLRAWMDGRGSKPQSKGVTLYNAAGETVATFEKLGQWLEGFTRLIRESAGYDEAQAIWELNEATFTAGMERASANPEAFKMFNDAARFAMEKRTPPMDDGQLL